MYWHFRHFAHEGIKGSGSRGDNPSRRSPALARRASLHPALPLSHLPNPRPETPVAALPFLSPTRAAALLCAFAAGHVRPTLSSPPSLITSQDKKEGHRDRAGERPPDRPWCDRAEQVRRETRSLSLSLCLAWGGAEVAARASAPSWTAAQTGDARSTLLLFVTRGRQSGPVQVASRSWTRSWGLQAF